jgi:hypothetical protein
MTNYFNTDPEDGFNPKDHGIEMDEIAKLYAMEDMKEDKRNWAREAANKFYDDFDSLEIPQAVMAIKGMINAEALDLNETNQMLDNMIQIFQDDEEYEKCHTCLQIKNGIND